MVIVDRGPQKMQMLEDAKPIGSEETGFVQIPSTIFLQKDYRSD